MKAVTVEPGTAGSVRLEDVPEPDAALGSVVVEALAAGICGTDAEITSGSYGWPPPGRDRLILGHESLGRVVDPGPSGFLVGEHVVGIVRRPDPAPCPNCAVGEWDMCSNGGYTERGIKQADGFMAERWRIEPDYAVRVDKDLGYLGVLLEPATVVAKAWEHIAAIGRRTFWDPHTVLVTGAGPIGLLAALIGVQQGADVHVLDRATSGQKPALVRQLGATYHTGAITGLGLQPDIVVECTGVAGLIRQALETISPGGILCLTGVGSPTAPATASVAALATDVVLKNIVLFGSVNTPNAVPDGLTVDHQGNIWVALWDGGALARYHPDGSLLAIIPLPVDRPTSCAFGDTGGGTLFVTTARDGLSEAALARQPDAGRVLRLDSVGVTGPPCEPYRGHATNG